MWNTFFFTLFFLLICVGIGLLLAILLDQKVKGEGIFRTIYLFPMALSFVVTGVVWQWIFAPGTQHPPRGMNALFGTLGLDSLKWKWYTDTTSISPFHVALIPVIIAASWQLIGYTMAMYLAGLRGVPEELREAARVDGANEVQIYRHIILPILQPNHTQRVDCSGSYLAQDFRLDLHHDRQRTGICHRRAGHFHVRDDIPGQSLFPRCGDLNDHVLDGHARDRPISGLQPATGGGAVKKRLIDPSRIAIYLLMLLFAALFLMPIYVMLASSLKTFAEVQDLTKMWSLPSGLNLESFRAALFGIPEKGLRGLSSNLLNSIYLTVPATLISAFLGSINGYVLSKWKFRGANVIFPLMLFGMFIPYQSVLIPMTLTLASIGLGGTFGG